MFTKDEAVEFLEKSWKVNNVETQLQTDRKKLLNKIIVLIQGKIPFHSLTVRVLARILPKDRKIPCIEDMEKICMSGNGGNCTYLNLFTYSLLKALGYATYLCRTTVTSALFNPHLVVIVKDLEKKGDIHLVDCGLGLPSFCAVSLNFVQESPVYRDSFLEYKFIRHGDEILRMHGQGDFVNHNKQYPDQKLDFCIGKWRRFYHFTVEMIEYTTLDDLGPLFTLQYLYYNTQPRAVWFPDGKAVLIMSGQLLVEKNDRTLEVTTMETKEEILKAYRKYFPTIDENVVSQAFAIWQEESTISKL